ncbi:MAG: glycosyltransferase family 9 protein [Vicinamibacterales bacterium]
MRELLTLYTLASVLVTNDSGPAHFASSTPGHTIVLFGPEPPLLFGSRITVDEVFDAVRKAVAA